MGDGERREWKEGEERVDRDGKPYSGRGGRPYTKDGENRENRGRGGRGRGGKPYGELERKNFVKQGSENERPEGEQKLKEVGVKDVEEKVDVRNEASQQVEVEN